MIGKPRRYRRINHSSSTSAWQIREFLLHHQGGGIRQDALSATSHDASVRAKESDRGWLPWLTSVFYSHCPILSTHTRDDQPPRIHSRTHHRGSRPRAVHDRDQGHGLG